LVALLKESEEIKINKPIYNRAQRKSIFQWALYEVLDENGYLNLRLEKPTAEKRNHFLYVDARRKKCLISNY